MKMETTVRKACIKISWRVTRLGQSYSNGCVLPYMCMYIHMWLYLYHVRVYLKCLQSATETFSVSSLLECGSCTWHIWNISHRSGQNSFLQFVRQQIRQQIYLAFVLWLASTLKTDQDKPGKLFDIVSNFIILNSNIFRSFCYCIVFLLFYEAAQTDTEFLWFNF